MGTLAIDMNSGKLIDLVEELTRRSREDVERQFADKPLQYCCAECLMQSKGLNHSALVSGGLSGLAADCSFRRGGFRRQIDYQLGGYKEELIAFRPAFWHPNPLLDEDGNRIERPCESSASIHHEFCRWIASSGHKWLLNGPRKEQHIVSVMARYQKEEHWREPDISVLWAPSASEAKRLDAHLGSGPKIIPFDRCIGLVAVEVQRSPISRPQIMKRTQDHLKNYADVRWVFVKGHLANLGPAREWLAEQALTAYVLIEETDKSRIIGIEELPPPRKQKTYMQQAAHARCLRSIYIYWLKLGYAAPEAMARAKADMADIKAGRATATDSVWEHQLVNVYGDSFVFSEKQIWLRQQRRDMENVYAKVS
jgi:hypothetical protein